MLPLLQLPTKLFGPAFVETVVLLLLLSWLYYARVVLLVSAVVGAAEAVVHVGVVATVAVVNVLFEVVLIEAIRSQ